MYPQNRPLWVTVVLLTLIGCAWSMPWPARYLAVVTGPRRRSGWSSKWGAISGRRVLDDGGTVWVYRYTGSAAHAVAGDGRPVCRIPIGL